MIHVSEIVLTFRSRITLRDGRVVRAKSDTFLGPLEEGSHGYPGQWLIPIDTANHAWASIVEIAEIRIVGDWDEWPAAIAGHVEEPASWPDYLPEGRSR